MSTIGLSSWAVDLKDVGAVYPFQGLEVPMVIAGIAFWIIWHLLQLRAESANYEKERKKYGDPEHIRHAIDRDH